MLSNISFLYTDITEVDFIHEKWSIDNGRSVVREESRINEDKETTYKAIAQLYRRLRRNYENNYRFAEAGDFFIGEMEMRRLDVTSRYSNKIINKIELCFRRNISFLSIYKLIGLYGESYIRPALWALFIIISYPILMNWWFKGSLNIINRDFLYINIRNSFASFFQIGATYIIERIIALPLLALLFIALKRKFERKK